MIGIKNNIGVFRPTTDIIKKSLFDILGDIKGLSFLDLFAGSGRVGLEALKRGAGEVVFVEKDLGCIKELRKKVTLFKEDKFQIIALDVFKAIKILKNKNKLYNIIFLDPPYYKNLAKKTLQVLICYDILAPDGFVIVQHYIKEELPDTLGDLILFRRKKYGQNLLSFFVKKLTKG